MAIYDNNGTTSYELGKVYDNNGTTSYQLGKVYDNNGSANSLLYEANLVILDDSQKIHNGTWAKIEWADGKVTVGDYYIQIYTSSAGEHTCAVNSTPIDTTNFSKITFYISDAYDVSDATAFGLVKSKTNTDYRSFDACSTIKMFGTGTHTLNISSLSGVYYFKFYLFSHNGYGARLRVTKIIVE